MNPAAPSLFVLALIATLSLIFLTSCTTVGDVEARGAAGWALGGFKISEEPKQQPDPAIIIPERSSGALSFRLHTAPTEDDRGGKKKKSRR